MGVKAIIEVAPEHIGMKADILVGVQLPKEQWYFKTESTAFPFIASDLEPPFIAAESSIELGSTQGINVFTGHFKNMLVQEGESFRTTQKSKKSDFFKKSDFSVVWIFPPSCTRKL